MKTTTDPEEHRQLLQKCNKELPTLRHLLATEPDRFKRFSRQHGELLLDFSRCAISDEIFAGLLDWAREADFEERRTALFAGEPINHTEHRPVLHALWRQRDFDRVLPAIEAARCEQALEAMTRNVSSLHRGQLPGVRRDGATAIRHVIHVGIGGSLLGPRLLCEVFPGSGPAVHFLSSVDAREREQLLARLDAREAIIVLVSKSFTTSEVMAHARRLVEWMTLSLGENQVAERLFAVTAAPEKAEQFGVVPDHILYMGDWTGGRFSLWSPVSFSAAISMGQDVFDRVCHGGARMDEHFRNAPLETNLPVIHGLLTCWHRNIRDYRCRALVPYDSRLRGMPSWLQQVEMESNGKSVDRSGAAVTLNTSPVVLGDIGTDAQHALFQAFHQGTEVVPVDFIGVIRPDHDDTSAQSVLLSHLLAQASALALGRDEHQTRAAMMSEGKPAEQIERLLPHRVMPGNRPSTMLLLDRLTPENLGQLLVLYEHSVFVSSVIWNINAFDQWGVELGKLMADGIEPALGAPIGEPQPDIPADIHGLQGLVNHIRQRREQGGGGAG